MMSSRRGSKRVACAVVVALAGVAGCESGSLARIFRPKAEVPPESAPKSMPSADPLLADTVGKYTLVSNMQGERVQGFGIVRGLGDKGSADCPTTIRDYLLDFFGRQQQAPKGRGGSPAGMSPGQFIDSLDTAVVEVTGTIPPGAKPGTLFDIAVQTIPGTSARTIEGGLLEPCEMRLFGPDAAGKEMLSGATVARAAGPVFTNPFGESREGGFLADPRHGIVLSGGYTEDENAIRLILVEPSYTRARAIERRINERFGHAPRASEALSQAAVILHTPPEYAEDPDHFVQLVAHLYLQNQPSFVDIRLRDLQEAVLAPSADYERIALLWEAIGPLALPKLKTLYGHANLAVSYYAAQTGLRLGDIEALSVVGQFASRPGNPYRTAAIEELGNCRFTRATVHLSPLLSDSDQEVRIAAYEALRRQKYAGIQTQSFRFLLDERFLNLVLDRVPSDGPPFIYVRRTGLPRIAVLGDPVRIGTPVFYADPDERVTLNANARGSELTVYGRSAINGRLSEAMSIPPQVAELVTILADVPEADRAGRLRGLGLGYAQVVKSLWALSMEGSGAIPARIVLETTPLTDVLGPEPTRERPEADVPARDANRNTEGRPGDASARLSADRRGS